MPAQEQDITAVLDMVEDALHELTDRHGLVGEPELETGTYSTVLRWQGVDGLHREIRGGVSPDVLSLGIDYRVWPSEEGLESSQYQTGETVFFETGYPVVGDVENAVDLAYEQVTGVLPEDVYA